MAGNRIYIQVDFQSQDATASINQLNENIKNIGTTSQNATKKAETGFNSLSVSISQATRGLDQIGTMLAGLGLARIGVVMVQAADDIKKTAAAFTAMGASAQQASAAIAEIRTVSKALPFSFDDMREMGQRLRGFGFELRQIPALLDTVANAAAALGKGKVGIDAITLALGQMRAKGIIQGQEAFRQLAEQGINSIKYLRDAIQKETGKAVSEMDVRKMIEKQMIGAEKGVQVILDGMKKEFGDVGEQMSKLPTAQFAKLTDDLKQLGAVIANDFTPAILGAIKLLREWAAAFMDMPAPIRDTAAALGVLVIALTAVGGAVKLGLFSWIGPAIALMKQLVTAFGTVRIAYGLLAEALSVNAFFGRLLIMVGLMIPALTTLASILAGVAAGFAGIKLGEWIREKIPPDSALGKLLNKDVEEQIKNSSKAIREQMEFTADLLQKRMVAAKIPGADKGPSTPFSKQSETELRDSVRHMQSLLDAEAVAAKARTARLVKENEELAKHQAEIAQQILERALAKMHGPIFGLTEKFAGPLRELKGNAIETAKVFQAMGIELEEAKQKVREENIKLLEDTTKKRLEGAKALQDFFAESSRYDTELYKKHLDYIAEADQMEMDTLRARLDYEQTALGAERDERLAALDTVHRQTLEQEIAYQQQALAIKIEYAYKIRDIQIQLEEQDYNRKLLDWQALNKAKLLSDADYIMLSEALTKGSAERMRQIIVNTDIAVSRDRLQAAKATNDAIYEEQKKIYDKLKSSLDRVFDALLHKSTSIWEAIGNGLKTAIIGAIKEIVTSRAAAALMQMFGYGTVAFGGGPRGLGGQQPTFGGGTAGGGGSFLSRALGLGGAAASFGSAGAPGGTGGFAGPVGSLPDFGSQASSATAAATQARSAPGIGMAGGLGGGLKGLLGLGNVAAFGGGAGGMAAAALSSPAAGIGGAMLGMAGVKRGGFAGLGMTVAGGFLTGAAIGMMIGGPFGAAIGAFVGTVVGAVIGTIRLFVKTSDEKLRAKIKTVYGIDVSDKGIRAQILALAQQKYGGNLDVAVRSPEVQQLVQLYAMSTGQTPGGMPRPMYGASFAQSGASGLQLQPVYSNGQAVANPYTGATTSQWASAGLYLQLNPQQANDLFAGKVVNVINNNPASVAQASASGARSGNSRDAARSALIEPLTVVR